MKESIVHALAAIQFMGDDATREECSLFVLMAFGDPNGIDEETFRIARRMISHKRSEHRGPIGQTSLTQADHYALLVSLMLRSGEGRRGVAAAICKLGRDALTELFQGIRVTVEFGFDGSDSSVTLRGSSTVQQVDPQASEK